ncbi:MAG: ribosome-binding factor A, partial [Gammaproteobacteria bacterium]
LNKASGFLRGQVGRAMKLRVVPHLRFHFDTLQGYSRHMDSLIRQAVGEHPAVPRDDNDDPVSDNPERDA